MESYPDVGALLVRIGFWGFLIMILAIPANPILSIETPTLLCGRGGSGFRGGLGCRYSVSFKPLNSYSECFLECWGPKTLLLGNLDA